MLADGIRKNILFDIKELVRNTFQFDLGKYGSGKYECIEANKNVQQCVGSRKERRFY